MGLELDGGGVDKNGSRNDANLTSFAAGTEQSPLFVWWPASVPPPSPSPPWSFAGVGRRFPFPPTPEQARWVQTIKVVRNQGRLIGPMHEIAADPCLPQLGRLSADRVQISSQGQMPDARCQPSTQELPVLGTAQLATNSATPKRADNGGTRDEADGVDLIKTARLK